MLEEQIQELKELPARVSGVELQIVQLRGEMRVEFSAVRTEMHAMGDGLRTEMHAMGDGLRTEMHQMREELREDIRIGVEESQNLAKLLVAQVSAELRNQVVARLERLIEMQRPDDRRT